MGRLVAIGLSPNIDGSDVRLAFLKYINRKSWLDEKAISELVVKFSEVINIPQSNLFPLISGRSGLVDALTILGIREDDEVIMQTFNCVAVLNTISWVKAKPVFVDIEKSTLNTSISLIEEKVTDKTKAIIVQHTFGLPVTDIQSIIEFAHSRNIAVIEDCAHALGASIGSQPVGTFGDIGVYSFGRDKMISSVFGGMLFVQDQYIKAAKRLYSDSDNVDEVWIQRQLIHPIITYVSLMQPPIKQIGKVIHYLTRKLGVISKATSPSEKACGPMPDWIDKKMPGALASLATKQLNRFLETNVRRHMIAKMYLHAGIVSAQKNTRGRVWLRFPVLVDNPKRYHKIFKDNGIIIGDWYDQVIAPKEVDLANTGYTQGETPVAEDICKHIINLPVYPRMTDKEVEKVINVYFEITNDR